MKFKTIAINATYIILISLIIAGWVCYSRVAKTFTEQSIQYSNTVTKYLSDRYREHFCIDKIIRNDYGLTAYCYAENNEDVIFTVDSSKGQIYYDTYIQTALEVELNTTVGNIIDNYTENYKVSSRLSFYNDPNIGEQRDVLYEKYQKIGRLPQLNDVSDKETFDMVFIDIYNKNDINSQNMVDEIKKLPIQIKKISIERYESAYDDKAIDIYSYDNTQ